MVAAKRQAKERKPTLSNVPDNILVKIYQHLPMLQRIQSERVCRRFRNVLKNHAFRDINKLQYRSLVMWDKRFKSKPKPRRRMLKGTIQKIFARCGRYLTEFDVSDFPERLHYTIVGLLPTCPRIRKLNLSGTQLYDSQVLKVGRALPNLIDVDLSCTKYSENAMSEFFRQLPNLRVVNLNRCLSPHTALTLKYLPSVVELNISGCAQIREKDVLALKDGCPNLEDLDISKQWLILLDRELKFDGWKSLKILRFNECSVSQDYNYNTFIFNDMPVLEECHLRYNRVVNDQTLRTLCIAAPNLVVLDLYSRCFPFMPRLNDYSLSCISNLRCLEHLVANSMLELTNQHVMSIAENGRLKYLMLSGCRQIGNSAVQFLLDSCKELTLLNVRCTMVGQAVAPNFLAYADEFEEGRAKLWVVSENPELNYLLNAHPKITCTPQHHDEY